MLSKIQRAFSVLALLVLGMFAFSPVASAADGQVGPPSTNINAVQVISLLVGTVLPIVVGLVTTRVTAPRYKALLLAALTAVSGFGSEFLAGPDHFNWMAGLLTTLETFVIAVATHYGLWRPTGVSYKATNSGVTPKGAHRTV